MLCPSCKTELVVKGQERLQTLGEHICNPNGVPSFKDKYVCPNADCIVASNVFWNSDGELYCEDFQKSHLHMQEGAYVDNNNAPFGSFRRKCNVEIYKKDENHTIFRMGKYRFEKVYSYQSNENGEILKRKWGVRIWKKEGNLETLHIPGIKMLIFSIKQFHSQRKWKNTPDLLDESLLSFRRGDWWRKVACRYAFVVNKFFPAKIKTNS